MLRVLALALLFMLLALRAPSAAAQEPVRVGVSVTIDPTDRVDDALALRTCLAQTIEGMDGVRVDEEATSWLRVEIMEVKMGDGRMVGYAAIVMAVETVTETRRLPWVLYDRLLMTIDDGPLRDTCSDIVKWYESVFIVPALGQ